VYNECINECLCETSNRLREWEQDFTLDEREFSTGAVHLVGDSEFVVVEIARFHFSNVKSELEVSTAYCRLTGAVILQV